MSLFDSTTKVQFDDNFYKRFDQLNGALVGISLGLDRIGKALTGGMTSAEIAKVQKQIEEMTADLLKITAVDKK